MSCRSFCLLLLSPLVSSWSDAGPFTIDDFSVDHPELSAAVGFGVTSAVHQPDILGGSRDLGLNVLTTPSTGTASVAVESGVASFDGTGVTPGHGGLVADGVLVVFDYDGGTDDSAFMRLTELGGIDFTTGGLTDAIAIDFLSFDYDISLHHSFVIALRDTGGHLAFLGLQSVDVRNPSPFTLVFPFDLTGLTPSQSIVDPDFDFGSMGGVAIQLSGDQMTFQVDEFRLASTAVVPEPGSLALVAMGAGWTCRRRGRRRSPRLFVQ